MSAENLSSKGLGKKEAEMKNRLLGVAAFAFILMASLLAAVPARAQSVDDKIKSLEQELSQLKEQQISMKKEAVSAEAALPSFSYRPGNGLFIEAADKAWGIRFTIESHFRVEFEAGRDEQGRTNGEMMLRRFRPGFFFCINNCLWEIEATLDMDGFGTGNAKNSQGAVGSIMQRGVVHTHLENLNPFLPTFDFGGDVSTSMSTARQGSSSTGTQMDYDLFSRNNGFNTGRAGWGYVLNWDDRSLEGIGIPGRIGRFQLAMASVGEGDDNLSSMTDKKDFVTYFSIQPMSQIKNKWLSGLTFEWGAWFCNNDPRAASAGAAAMGGSNGCAAMAVQDNGDSRRQTLYTTGADSIGRGLTFFTMPGLTWEVGPYRLRAWGAFQTNEDGHSPVGATGHKSGNGWGIGHDLFLWSPKGFLTGSSATPGSIYFGTHFERDSYACGTAAVAAGGTRPCTTNGTTLINNGEFHRERVLVREWDLWYFVAPRMSIGASLLWYDASNLRTGRNQAGDNLAIFPKSCRTGTACRGRGGDWTDANLNWRYTF
ncbi:MAG TPA: hypothetical protein VIB79_12365 [Candidatus Binatia bacterium]